ncbi:MAG: signal peptide peptidase SppA [Bacteroidales bacterium]|nr:signal peptide peptidase SppA [Bacteroidales bacterium]
MLRRFFISMLGAMAAFWLSLFILVFMSIVAVAVIASSALSKDTLVKGAKVLYLELQGEIPERQDDFNVESLLDLDFQGPSLTLAQITEALRLAADDKEVKGVYIDCKGSSLGIASRSEVVEALQKFKDAGKWVYAYSDNYMQGDYYVSTVADKLYLNPVGMIDVHGLAATTVFYTDVLKKLGIEVQVFKVGEFKSAVEPYIRTSMSEPSRRQTTEFLTQIWRGISGQMAEARDVDVAQVNSWADGLSMTWAPEKYVESKMVTELLYRSEVEKLLKAELNVKDDEDLPKVTPVEYLEAKGKLGNSEKKHIAVLYAVGSITDDGKSGIVATKLVPEIQKLAENDKVKGLVLRVNSGGGSAFASEQIWKALEDFKATGKPFYVSMGDYAASGGYYISCGADRIFADAATLTGSIGIFGLIPNAKNLLTDKIGLKFETVETNRNANFPNLYNPMTPAQAAGMQSYVERGYETFTSRVAEGRHIPIDSVKAIGGGRVWDGTTALRIGLVDEIGSLSVAINALATQLGMDSDRYVNYPAIKDKWLDLLMGDMPSINAQLIPQGEIRDCIKAAWELSNASPLQTRMEEIIIN